MQYQKNCHEILSRVSFFKTLNKISFFLSIPIISDQDYLRPMSLLGVTTRWLPAKFSMPPAPCTELGRICTSQEVLLDQLTNRAALQWGSHTTNYNRKVSAGTPCLLLFLACLQAYMSGSQKKGKKECHKVSLLQKQKFTLILFPKMTHVL